MRDYRHPFYSDSFDQTRESRFCRWKILVNLRLIDFGINTSHSPASNLPSVTGSLGLIRSAEV